MALDWKNLQKAEDVETVKSFLVACVADSVECLGAARNEPEICNANLETCEASGIAVYRVVGGLNDYGLDDTTLTVNQMLEVVDAYEV